MRVCQVIHTLVDTTELNLCACGLAVQAIECCQRYILGQETAPTPEALMRSRYVAYCHQNIDYLVATTHPEIRRQHPAVEIRAFAQAAHFIKLDVLQASDIQQITDDARVQAKGYVEFIAHYMLAQTCEQIHENSLFLCENGVWYYYKGEHLVGASAIPEAKQGRNDPCHCGSGKKFKKCCG